MTNATQIEAQDVQVGDKILERADGYFYAEDTVFTVQRVEHISEFIDSENREAHYVRFDFGPGAHLVTEPTETVEVVR